MIWIVSWRNVWRNKLRSSVVIIAIALGIFAGVFATAFMKGMTEQRIKSAIESEVSHIQIHQAGFTESSDIDLFITNVDSLTSTISKLQKVKNISKRIVLNSMAASAETATGIKLIGVEPEIEIRTTNINEKIIEGQYLEGIKRNPIVIGKKLAEKLNLKLRSKIIITFQDFEGNITGCAFRVAGIFNSGNGIFDETTAFVRFSDIERLSGLPENSCHELAIKLSENLAAKEIADSLSKRYSNYEIQPWTKLKPEIGYMTEIMDLYMYIFVGIILFALAFGIVNTMLMVVLERIKELGMLMAVGMNRLRVFNMIVLETVFLTLTGGIIGIIIGSLTAKYFSIHPINLSLYSEGLESIGWESFVYTSVNLEMIITVTIMVIIAGVLAAIYPAIKALRSNPAEALRIE
ncbi:MAG: ABC transporter permease [Bacteroidales bacterium]|nr:ABC transporter permease [Bacteroidales bacterium]